MITEGDNLVAIGFYHTASHFKSVTAGMTVSQKTEYCAAQAIDGYDTHTWGAVVAGQPHQNLALMSKSVR